MKRNNTVLVVDGGGRGAALCNAYAKSRYVQKIIVTPGNDLIPRSIKKEVKCYPQVKTTDVLEILTICKEEQVTLVDVAQDSAVEKGLVDLLLENGFTV